MPMYEYACAKCGKLFEELVFSAADEAEVVCPACGAAKPKRCLSASAALVAGATGREAVPAPPSGGCGSPGGGGFR